MNTFGSAIRVTIFGQSHSEGMGVVIDGLPTGFEPDMAELKSFMERRAPGRATYSTPRREADSVELISGLAEGRTCGAPLCAVIRNTDAQSSDYRAFEDVPRPGHADMTAHIKYGGFNDIRGGGQFSGRLTAPLCAAGGLAIQLLKKRGVAVGAHIAEIAGIADVPYDPVSPDIRPRSGFPTLSAERGAEMRGAIDAAREAGDSVGGVIECAVTGLPAGLGEPMFSGVENVISQIVFAVPAVKGIEFGSGFSGSKRRGSENNDPFLTDGGRIYTETNNAGGILGGITTGMPVVFRAAIKPTPSISSEQRSVSLSRMESAPLSAGGRHDPCIVPRAVPVIEAAAAIAALDMLLMRGSCEKWI